MSDVTSTPPNPFMAGIAGRELWLGSWLMANSPLIAEAMGHAGFRWLVVDMEHSPLGLGDGLALLQAVAGTQAIPVVRLASNDAVLIKQALDMGAQTLMIPLVQNAAEARTAVAAMKYPPLGTRGYAAMTRGSRFGTVADYGNWANRTTACIVQLETPAAIAQLEDIAAVPGVDALFVGPGDLSAALGLLGRVDHPDVLALIAAVPPRAKVVNKPVGIVGPTPVLVGKFIEYGYDYVAIASDLGMMMRQAQAFIGALNQVGGKHIDSGGY
ncbi:MAG: aldolase/citrate lyase family protein [Candidatus Symbiobacter sp.]|nr:aldolase/citrate lyase family protein [Candidatus Symbiobacter sp.]